MPGIEQLNTLAVNPQGLSASAAIVAHQRKGFLRRSPHPDYVCVKPRYMPTSPPSRIPVRGRFTKVRCMSRRCRGCAMTLAIWDREFVEGGLIHHAESKLLTFITVSEPTTARSFADSGAALTSFVRGLNAFALGGRVRAGLPWVAVGELSPKNKRLHWHLLVAGVCYPWCSKAGEFGDQLRGNPGELVTDPFGRSGVALSKKSTLLPLAAANGFGAGFVGMRQVRTSGQDWSNVGAYMGKYLSKGDAGVQLPKGFQLVRASRRGHAWWPGHTLVSVRRERKMALAESRSRRSSGRPFLADASTHERAASLTAGADWTQPKLTLT